MRRALLIGAAVILLIGIGVGVYFLFFTGKSKVMGTGGVPAFPNSGNSDVPTTIQKTTQDLGVPVGGAGTEVAPRLIRISDSPVALGGVAVYVPGVLAPATTTSASSTPMAHDPDVRIEYIERESGNIYDFEAHARTLTRLTNKTLPGIQTASWLPDGSLAYVRFLERSGVDDHIDTYALPANGSDGYFLEQDLSQVSVGASSTLMTVLSTTNGSSATLSSASGTNLRTLFSSLLSAITVRFAGPNFVATTKPSAKSDGYAFTVDAKTGTFTRALGPLQSLTTLPSPNGKFILYSYLERNKISLAVFDVTTHLATRLPLVTYSDKCVWSIDGMSIYCGVPTTFTGASLDDWYQGAATFSDRLWKIDLREREAVLLIDPKQAGNVDIDMVSLALDRTTDVLIFSNKRDGTFWMYDL